MMKVIQILSGAITVSTLYIAIETNFVQAATIQPISYDMLNGNGRASGGSFNYWDINYTGSGNTTQDNAPLTGGLGDLTDGIIPNQNWFNVENLAGTGPYVGWLDINPTITFNFGSQVNIDSLTIYVDDSNGRGGVSVPNSAQISMGGGVFNSDQLIDPISSAPTSYTFSNLGFNGTSLDLTLNRRTRWVFLSEVEFQGTPIPEPLTILGTATALGFGALFKKKKLSSKTQ